MNCLLNILIAATLLLCLKADIHIIQTPPTLIKQPLAAEIFVHPQDYQNGKHIKLECEAKGEPSAIYYWKKNGKHFNWQQHDDHIMQQSGRGTLLFSDFSDFDTGTYQCFAENNLGTASSNEVTITFAYLDPFKPKPPLIVNGVEGQPLKLMCEPPRGKPKPRILWFKQYNETRLEYINNSRITFDPEGRLWFSYLTKDDVTTDFKYVCAATSEAALTSDLRNKYCIDIRESSYEQFEPILQYVTKNNKMKERGKNIELFCIFGGNPTPTILWSKNGIPIENTDRIKQRNFGKSLLIKTVDFNDKGEYTCEANNGIGLNKTHSIEIEVLARPYFIEEPESVTKVFGESVELRCVASGNPEPSINWSYNGISLDKAFTNPRRLVREESLVIHNVTRADTGNYGCKAFNPLGNIYKDVFINIAVNSSQRKTKVPTDLEAYKSENIILECSIIGTPELVIKWYYDNEEVINNTRFSIFENGSLNIQDLKLEDSGDYQCHASNTFGNVIKTVRLKIKKHTYIIRKPSDLTVEVNCTAIFTCEAVNEHNLKIQVLWLHNGEDIDVKSGLRFVKTSMGDILKIAKVQANDAGIYTCITKTHLDEDMASANLTVQSSSLV